MKDETYAGSSGLNPVISRSKTNNAEFMAPNDIPTLRHGHVEENIAGGEMLPDLALFSDVCAAAQNTFENLRRCFHLVGPATSHMQESGVRR